ncbi:MAG: PqqD family protein [Lachnospiraceae bacterium]|nr:PqqD family protein [Lachnospiraceae bacterium]
MKKAQKLQKNYLDFIFIPEPELAWTKREDGIVVLDMVHQGFFHRIAQKFFHKPRVSHIALDKYGTALWLAMDETHTVSELVAHMEDTFPEERERMLDRSVTFLNTLQMHHFIRQSETSK